MAILLSPLAPFHGAVMLKRSRLPFALTGKVNHFLKILKQL